nr:hypothetical protein [Paenibacillus lutrae]
MRALPAHTSLTKAQLLTEEFLIERCGPADMYYAPHNEYMNRSAQVVIIGLTPGWTQMKAAFEEARRGLELGLTQEAISKAAKEEASFAGTMRHNLTGMLNTLGLHHYLGIPSCGELFLGHRNLLHTTSLLRYPVFIGEKNYTGSNPDLLTTAFLRERALAFLAEELSLLDRPLIIPLGKKVEGVMHLARKEGILDPARCLWGFPHPSGANGHRLKQFNANLEEMRRRLREIGGAG